MSARADGRFAPSPTGPLHLGSLRTALLAWLFARSQKARFLVRIEDLDPQRSRAEFETLQLDQLAAIGIESDEPPVRQSERTELYEAALRHLDTAGALYPCFCSRAELREAASAPHGEIAPDAAVPTLPPGAYPGTCLGLTAAQRRERERRGRPPSLRMRVGAEAVAFVDRLLGPQAGLVDDFVVRRADGVASYQLAVVVDDAAQGIGEIVRGADLASSTPRQIVLQRRLELPTPRYAHVGLVLGPDGSRLAKRQRGSKRTDHDEPPQRMLALLAHSLGLALGAMQVTSPAELLGEFDPDRLATGPVTLEV